MADEVIADVCASLRDQVHQGLQGTNYFNPANKSLLEKYVQEQCEMRTSDLDANLALLKLYQFNPSLIDFNFIFYILVKALCQLPEEDFVKCRYLLSPDVMGDEGIRTLVAMHHCLQMGKFAEFWEEASKCSSVILDVVDGFHDDIRKYIADSHMLLYAEADLTEISQALNLKAEDVDIYAIERGWIVTAGTVTFPTDFSGQETSVIQPEAVLPLSHYSKFLASSIKSSAIPSMAAYTVYADPTSGYCPSFASFFGHAGITAACVLTAFGAAFGTMKAGVAVSSAGTFKPEIIMRSLIPVIMAGIVSIYGVVIAVVISQNVTSASYSLFGAALHLAAGLSAGFGGLASGYAIGIAGEASVCAFAQQPRVFVPGVVILIFAEVLGLYGLIVGLILVSRMKQLLIKIFNLHACMLPVFVTRDAKGRSDSTLSSRGGNSYTSYKFRIYTQTVALVRELWSHRLTLLTLVLVLSLAANVFFIFPPIASHARQADIDNTRPVTTLDTSVTSLIIVPGHAVMTGTSVSTMEDLLNESNWYLKTYQHGQVPTLLSHIQKGIELARQRPKSLLVFSGGQTRAFAGPRSEGQSYWLASDIMNLFIPDYSGLKDKNDTPQLLQRVTTEEYAKDSFENVLFSIARFREVTGRYPESITVVGFAFKRDRFMQLHRTALRFPIDRFFYVGIDPAGMSTDEEKRLIENEREKSTVPFVHDMYGCQEELTQKRRSRNPFRRFHGYFQSAPEMSALLAYCHPTKIYPGLLPW